VDAGKEDTVGAAVGLRDATRVSHAESTRGRAGGDEVTVGQHSRSVTDRVPSAAPHLDPTEIARRCAIGGDESVLRDHGRIAVAGERSAAEVDGPAEGPGCEDAAAVGRDSVDYS